MQYQSVVSQKDLLELRHNSTEVADNLWVSRLPSQEESIAYELKGGFLIVKYEENEDGRITFSNVTYKFNRVSTMIALACALHKRSMFKVGASVYDINVVVNQPDGIYHVEIEGNSIIRHQANGLVFLREGDFYVAVSDSLLAQIYISRLGLSIHSLIDHDYLIRFQINGKYRYFPMAYVYIDPIIRESFLKGDSTEYQWDNKALEIEMFVEEYTK